MNQYEAMFLFDPTFGSSFDKCETEIRRLMERAGAEIILCKKWDERRLAFRIKGRKRGVYVLTYFNAPPDGVASLEHDAKLAENILRLLVLRADDLTRDDMELAAGDPQEEAGQRADAPESKPEVRASKEPARETVQPLEESTKTDAAEAPAATE